MSEPTNPEPSREAMEISWETRELLIAKNATEMGLAIDAAMAAKQAEIDRLGGSCAALMKQWQDAKAETDRLTRAVGSQLDEIKALEEHASSRQAELDLINERWCTEVNVWLEAQAEIDRLKAEIDALLRSHNEAHLKMREDEIDRLKAELAEAKQQKLMRHEAWLEAQKELEMAEHQRELARARLAGAKDEEADLREQLEVVLRECPECGKHAIHPTMDHCMACGYGAPIGFVAGPLTGFDPAIPGTEKTVKHVVGAGPLTGQEEGK